MKTKVSAEASPRNFQKAAAHGTPRLYNWGARALFVGPSLNLSAHRNAVAVVAVGIDGAFGVANDPRRPEQGATITRSALIPPNTLHHLSCPNGRMAFLYVDARSRDFARLDEAVATRTKRAGFELACEAALIKLFRALAKGRTGFPETRSKLERTVLGNANTMIHPRVLSAIRRLHQTAADRPTLAQLSKMAGLSPSRFRHLFVEATGVPLRRYRLWIAMGTAMRCLARGKSLTEAAHDAGFSSSAHFSASYRQMFGLEPSRLVRAGLQRSSYPATSP